MRCKTLMCQGSTHSISVSGPCPLMARVSISVSKDISICMGFSVTMKTERKNEHLSQKRISVVIELMQMP